MHILWNRCVYSVSRKIDLKEKTRFNEHNIHDLEITFNFPTKKTPSTFQATFIDPVVSLGLPSLHQMPSVQRV